MHILNRLKIELKAAVEAGGPSEETFYKEWSEDQRKSYIDEHPNSRFAQKENDNKSIETKPTQNEQNIIDQPSTKTSEVFNPLKKNFDPKTKEFIKKIGSSAKFKKELLNNIRSWTPSHALFAALPMELIDSLETKGSQWFNDRAAFANGYIDVDEYINKSGKSVSDEDKKKLEATQFLILKGKLGKDFKENTKKLKSTVNPESFSKFNSLPISLQGKVASIYNSADDDETSLKNRLEQAINVASEMDNLRKNYPDADFAYDREWMTLKPEGFSEDVNIQLSSDLENPLRTTPNLGCSSVKEFFNKLSELKKDPRLKKLCPPFSDIEGAETLDRYDRLVNDFNIPKQNLTVKRGKMHEIIFSYIDSDGREKRFTVDNEDPNKFLKYPSYSDIKDLNKFLGEPLKKASKGIEI